MIVLSRRVRLVSIVASASLVFAGRANAELGGSLSTLKSDSEVMDARLVSVAMGRYMRHDLTRTNGGMVHELTNPDGQVFAVTWAGPGKPNLRALLGNHFAAYQAANGAAGRTMHSLRRPLQLNQSDLQIQTSGHMGWFRGVALIPSLAPAGFSPADLSQEH